MTLAHLPAATGSAFPEKAALISGGEEITFAELDRQSNRAANALLGRGIVAGDRIAILSVDSPASICLLFGIAKIRAVAVILNYRLTPGEIAAILDDAEVKLLFVSAEFEPLILRLPERTHLPDVLTIPGQAMAWTEIAPDPALEIAATPEDAVAQLYTSGTTGRPKGVQLPNRSFFAIAQALEAAGDPWIGWTSASVSLLFVPTFHIGGLWWLVRGLALGSTTVLLKSFDPAAILRAIPQYRVNKTCMVPAMMQILLREPGCRTTDFRSLETIVYGGAPVSIELLEQASQVLQCDLCQIYGMTETGNMAVSLRPADHLGLRARQFVPAGRPLPGVEVRILDPLGQPVSGTGEIVIRSPARMIGYWNQMDATRAAMTDGWIRTGDAGYIDADGFLCICDRVKDMIISAGENIFPAEIENAIRRHPEVADVAVIGIPDNLWGEVVKAVVVRSPGSQLRAIELIRHVRTHLAEFKVPKSVDFVEQLPRNATGKLLKRDLREKYWGERERAVN